MVGERGSIVRDLIHQTGCKISAISDECLPHCVEVMSQSRSRAKQGAYIVIDHVKRSLAHLLNDHTVRQCYFDWSNESALDKIKYENNHSPPSLPPVQEITTANQTSNRNIYDKSTDFAWRIWLPEASFRYKGKERNC